MTRNKIWRMGVLLRVTSYRCRYRYKQHARCVPHERYSYHGTIHVPHRHIQIQKHFFLPPVVRHNTNMRAGGTARPPPRSTPGKTRKQRSMTTSARARDRFSNEPPAKPLLLQHRGDCSAVPSQLSHLHAQLLEVLEPPPAGREKKEQGREGHKRRQKKKATCSRARCGGLGQLESIGIGTKTDSRNHADRPLFASLRRDFESICRLPYTRDVLVRLLGSG